MVFSISQSLLEILQKFCEKSLKIKLFQASSVEQSTARAITIPGCTQEVQQKISGEIYKDLGFPIEYKLEVDKRLFLRRFILFSLGPSLLLIFLNRSSLTHGLILGGLWLVISTLWNQKYHRSFSFSLFEKGMKSQRGFLNKNGFCLYWKNVQSIVFAQSPYQKRKELCDIIIHTAAGNVRIPYIKMVQAGAFRDLMARKVSQSREAWM